MFGFIHVWCQTDTQSTESVSAILKALTEVAGIPGLSISISKNGTTVFTRSYGYSDIEKMTIVNDSALFRIGSVTKLFTATVLLKLIEEKKMKESDLAISYIKNLPDSYRNITIEQLAAHTSGIRHYTRAELNSSDNIEYKTLTDGLNKFTSDTLLFVPGTKYKYSSYGYVLLGAIIEKKTNKPFNTVLEEQLFNRAGMKATVPDLIDAQPSNLCQFYYPSDTTYRVAKGINNSHKWPAGGYYSNPADLAKFGNALLDVKILKSESIPILFNSRKTSDGKGTGVGFGFRDDTDYKGRKVVSHGGISEGARSFFMIYPDQKLVIAICANLFQAPIFEGEAQTISGFFLGDYAKAILENKTYKFISKTESGKELTGEIEIKGNSGIISGWGKKNFPVIGIVKDREQVRIIAASRNGIINIWLSESADGYEGKWGYGKPSTSISLR
jgi:CubicO group peptidase (beta-lactamase class C family)